jgi:predicted outer membrane repeat protein
VSLRTNGVNGAIRVLLVPVPAVGSRKAVPTMTFTNNVAGQGGGAVYVGRQNEYIFLLRGTTFAGNAVTGSRGTGGALAFNDGKWFGQLAAFGLVRRSWLQGLYGGALFHPGYNRHYGDTELTLIARQQKRLAYHPHALLIEVDHDKDRRAVDAADRDLFLRRAATGFDNRVVDPALLSSFS